MRTRSLRPCRVAAHAQDSLTETLTPEPRPYPYAILDIQPGAEAMEAASMFGERMMLILVPEQVALRVENGEGVTGLKREGRAWRGPFAVPNGRDGALKSFCLAILCFDRYVRAKQNLKMIGMIPLSSIAMSAYTDLVRLLKDDALSGVESKPTLKERGDKAYWYAARRVGTEMRFIYIGEDSDDTRARIDRIEELRATAKDRQAERSRLVRLLRAEGMTPTDRATGSILSAMAAAGTFRLGGTIVGTNAFRLYEGELGVRLPVGGMANTGDIDIAQFEKLSVALQDQVDPGLAETFSALKFDPLPALDQGRTWRWAQGGSGQLVEFLTPAFGDETIRELPALGVNAQGLNYLNFLIAEPIHAAAIYRSGILVQVPRPERYAIHKLIIADRRRDGAGSLKSAKDREQAAFLIEAMAEDRPDDLARAYAAALEVGPRWREHIGNSLTRMPETKGKLDSLDA